MTQIPSGMPGLPPWHMWGSSVKLRVPVEDPANPRVVVTSNQLARIGYKRPETWSFFLAYEIVGSSFGLVPVGDDLDLWVSFEVAFGVGRSRFETTGVSANAAFNLAQTTSLLTITDVLVPSFPFLGRKKWSTCGLSPELDQAVPPRRERIDWLPAQDLQCVARSMALHSVMPANSWLDLMVTAYFAPRSHVRPEWFMEAPNNVMFRGGETGGT